MPAVPILNVGPSIRAIPSFGRPSRNRNGPGRAGPTQARQPVTRRVHGINVGGEGRKAEIDGGCASCVHRFVADSPQEGTGFELLVPGRAIRPFGRGEDVFQ